MAPTERGRLSPERVHLLESVYRAAKARFAVWTRDTYIALETAIAAFERYEKDAPMPLGPGKYDDLATTLREVTQADIVAVMIVRGNQGTGFSVQSQAPLDGRFALMLRQVADEIERTTEAPL